MIIWQFLAGLSLFLFGMHIMEDAIRDLAGRTFKLFLKKYTGNRFLAVTSGTLVTAMLQSSSVVSMMVLAFVGAGILRIENGITVILGCNLGTTLDSWVVAMLGFKLNLESFSLPVIGLSGLIYIFWNERKQIRRISMAFLGFGLLFLGLGLMKEAMEGILADFHFEPYRNASRVIFILIGFILTVLIQSSSATVVITLSALNTGQIPLEAAAGVIIGAELGTSIKFLVVSIGGLPEKRKIALGNVLFNAFITIFSAVFLIPLLDLARLIMGDDNNLMSLVLFQSIINFIGLVIVFPFINSYTRLLNRLVKGKKITATAYLPEVSVKVTGAALDALEKEVALFLFRIIMINRDAYHITGLERQIPTSIINKAEEQHNKHLSYHERYEFVKQAESEILSFCIRLRREDLTPSEQQRVDRLIHAVRDAMYSAKGMKDIRQDRKEIGASADSAEYDRYISQKKRLQHFYSEASDLLQNQDQSTRFEMLVRMMHGLRQEYEKELQEIHASTEILSRGETGVSTFLNVNREVYSSCKSLIFAMRDLLLTSGQAEDFDDIPSRI